MDAGGRRMASVGGRELAATPQPNGTFQPLGPATRAQAAEAPATVLQHMAT